MFEGVTEEMLAKARAENDALMAAERLLKANGYIVRFIHEGNAADEMAIRLLYAWNNVAPETGTLDAYKWPDGFPEGSREGWRRVMRAAHEIVSPSSNGRTPHFDCGNEGSSPSGELVAFQHADAWEYALEEVGCSKRTNIGYDPFEAFKIAVSYLNAPKPTSTSTPL